MPSPKATTAQRDHIDRLLRAAEFDRRTITLMHTRCGCDRAMVGKPVATWLNGLSMQQASGVIETLQRIAGEDGND